MRRTSRKPTKLVIQDQLRRLSNAELTEKDERQAWSAIGRRAGAALKSPSVTRVLEGLVTAAVRHQLNICHPVDPGKDSARVRSPSSLRVAPSGGALRAVTCWTTLLSRLLSDAHAFIRVVGQISTALSPGWVFLPMRWRPDHY